jgi:hypothetical protein
MANPIKMTGVTRAIGKLRKIKTAHAHGYQMGLIRAGLLVQRDSQLIVPVDTTNLKSSAGTRHGGKGFTTVVFVIYTAGYAIYVHEDLEAGHAAGKTAKFLEIALRQNKRKIVEIVKLSMKIASKIAVPKRKLQ